MQVLLSFSLLWTLLFAASGNEYRIDFGSNTEGDAGWYIINDGVMGGQSIGQGELKEESVLFKGVISLKNNGGFASMRSPFGRVDLSNFEQIKIRYRATGEPCKIMLESSRQFWQPYLAQRLDPTESEWRTVRFELDALQQYRLAQPTGRTATQNVLKDIIRVGIMTDSKNESAFEIEIDYIVFE